MATADFNNDGLNDIYFVDCLKSNTLYLNKALSIAYKKEGDKDRMAATQSSLPRPIVKVRLEKRACG